MTGRKIITVRDVLLPPLPSESTDIYEAVPVHYIWHSSGRRVLKEYVMDPFYKSLRSASGWGKDNIPEEDENEMFIDIDGFVFETSAMPKPKTVEYKSIISALESWIAILIGDYIGGVRRRGVRTFRYMGKAEPYIEHGMVIDFLETEKSKRMEEKSNDVRVKIQFLRPEEIKQITPEKMGVDLKRDYSILTALNAREYVLADNMHREGNKRYREIRERVIDDALKLEWEGNKVAFELNTTRGQYIITVMKNERPAYGKIYDEFMKEIPLRARKGSVAGDMRIIREMLSDRDIINRLSEKGVFVDEGVEGFMSDYDPRFSGNNAFIRLHGIRERLRKYTEKHTGIYYEMGIDMNI